MVEAYEQGPLVTPVFLETALYIDCAGSVEPCRSSLKPYLSRM
jgi:hypothetical protein